MLDAASAALAFDTTVVDDPDAPRPFRLFPPAPEPSPAPATGRVPTEELTMQVLVLGQWHRRTPDLAETACGVPVRLVETPPRREVLTYQGGDLCETCFTPHERARARRADLEAQAAAEAEDRRWHEQADQRATDRARRHTTKGPHR